MSKRDRFVQPETARLELSEGDFIIVKRRLSYGEQQALTGAGLTQLAGVNEHGQPLMGIDWAAWQVERLFVWLTDWSFTDREGRPVALTREAISALDPATVAEIDAALTRHVEAMTEASKSGCTPDAVAERGAHLPVDGVVASGVTLGTG